MENDIYFWQWVENEIDLKAFFFSTPQDQQRIKEKAWQDYQGECKEHQDDIDDQNYQWAQGLGKLKRKGIN